MYCPVEKLQNTIWWEAQQELQITFSAPDEEGHALYWLRTSSKLQYGHYTFEVTEDGVPLISLFCHETGLRRYALRCTSASIRLSGVEHGQVFQLEFVAVHRQGSIDYLRFPYERTHRKNVA